MLTKYLNKQQIIVLTILLFLLTVGIDFELSAFYGSSATANAYFVTLVDVALLAIYIVPITLLIQYFRKKWDIKLSYWVIIFFFGLFTTGWLASYGNSIFGDYFWAKFLPASFYKDWQDALTAPFVEETVKAVVVFLLLKFLQIWKKEAIFLAAFTVGFGFQIMEDISYITLTSFDAKAGDFSIAFDRISGGLASHGVYTALVVFGLYALLKQRDTIPLKKSLAWFVGPIFLHFLWDTPLVNTWSVDSISFVSVLDSIVLIFLFLDLFSYINTPNVEKIA